MRIQMEGPLFEAVQRARVFPDQKTFVDCFPKSEPGGIMAEYETRKDEPGFDLASFVHAHFNPPDTPDISDSALQGLSLREYIDRLWPMLECPADSASKWSTLIPMQHPYIVPGGRFREIYYWDSFFTSAGLVVAGNTDMVMNMARNFACLIETTGHVPNGNRYYYTSRSQPPFFCSIIQLLENMRGFDSVSCFIPVVEKEYDYWMKGHERLSPDCPAVLKCVRMPDGSILNRFYDESDTPRQESWLQDVELCEDVQPDNPGDFYRHIRSAAESGWDFSSRWFADNQSMRTIRTTDIVPVDLNCILYGTEMALGRWHERLGNDERAKNWRKRADARLRAIQIHCWDEQAGFFFDVCRLDAVRTATWSLAGVYPLYFGLVSSEQAGRIAKNLETRFLKDGGLLTTLTESTGQQWDSPNGWAPLQWLAVQGLLNHNHTRLACLVAQRFVHSADTQYRLLGKVLEKFDMVNPEAGARGGEYHVQVGFGWTNGIVVALLGDPRLTISC